MLPAAAARVVVGLSTAAASSMMMMMISVLHSDVGGGEVADLVLVLQVL